MNVIPRDPFEPLPADWRSQLRARWPNGERLRVAWALAADVDTLRDLLLGLPVDRDRIRSDGLEYATEQRLITLSRPIDLVIVEAA